MGFSKQPGGGLEKPTDVDLMDALCMRLLLEERG